MDSRARLRGPILQRGVFDAEISSKQNNTKFNLQLTDNPKAELNRLHIDLITSDGPVEVKRLEALGATRVIPRTYPSPDVYYVVMADPEGNEFCVSPVPPDEIDLFKKVYQPY